MSLELLELDLARQRRGAPCPSHQSTASIPKAFSRLPQRKYLTWPVHRRLGVEIMDGCRRVWYEKAFLSDDLLQAEGPMAVAMARFSLLSTPDSSVSKL